MNDQKHLMPKHRLLLVAAGLLIPASAMLFGQDNSRHRLSTAFVRAACTDL